MQLSGTKGIIMKNYTITVNGTAYDVTVDEVGAGAAPAAAPGPAFLYYFHRNGSASP